MAVEYHTARHAKPLVLLPRMGIMYLDDGDRSYQMWSRFLKNLNLKFDHIIENGGDLCLTPCVEERSGMILCIFNAEGNIHATISSSRDLRRKKYNALLKIQRFMRSVLWKIRKPSHHLKQLRAFQATDMAESLPVDVVFKVVDVYLEGLSLARHQSHSKSSLIVKTNSFLELRKLNV